MFVYIKTCTYTVWLVVQVTAYKTRSCSNYENLCSQKYIALGMYLCMHAYKSNFHIHGDLDENYPYRYSSVLRICLQGRNLYHPYHSPFISVKLNQQIFYGKKLCNISNPLGFCLYAHLPGQNIKVHCQALAMPQPAFSNQLMSSKNSACRNL